MKSPNPQYLKAGIIYNPISGGGNSARLATELENQLSVTGVTTEKQHSQAVYDSAALSDWLNTINVLCICGGDGTLRGLLPALANTRTPWYMLPAGHESLTAKYFSMSANPATVVQHLQTRSSKEHYFCCLHNEAFFSMASIGFDSLVLESIGTRKGPSSTLLYIQNSFRCIRGYRGAAVTIVADNAAPISFQSGYCIFSNSPTYARGISFAPNATSEHPDLHFAWNETANFFFLLRVFWALAFKSSRLLPELNHGKAFKISITLDKPYPAQCDGDSITLPAGVSIPITVNPEPVYPLCPD